MIAEEDKEFNDQQAISASIRAAKKASRPDKIGVPEKRPTRPAKKSKAKKLRKGGSAFESDFGSKTASREGIRSRKDDAQKGAKKSGSKGNMIKGKGKGKPSKRK